MIDVLEKLAMSFKNGKCIVVSDRKILNKIYDHRDLSINTRKTFKYIFDNIANYKSYESQFGSVIISDISGEGVTYKRFAQSEFDQSPILLSENVKDANLYRNIISYIANRKEYDCKIHVDTRGGGGDTTAEEFKNLSTNDRFILCIVDNDKKYPNCGIGQTAKKIIDYTKLRILDNAFVYIIDAREIENVIPLSLIERNISANDARKSVIQYVNRLQIQSGDFRRYLDIKSGIKITSYREYILNPDYRRFWGSNLEDVARVMGTDGCLCGANKCHCLMLPAFGSNMINIILEKFGEIVEEDMDEFTLGIWEDIFNAVSRFCVGKKRTAVEYMPAI
ncbi:hypothetical protein [Deinococcus aquaticus]|uniref:hypothetical protein n=1 Tax=Deinococcus aquaticus TaxID=328692 RepID=UPI003F482710